MAGAGVHPMHGPNKFKLGVFSMNSDGGLTLTKVPERWPAIWSEIVEVSQLADRAGFEFLLPIARWKGFGGEMNSREWSFETLTHAAALGAVTKNIGQDWNLSLYTPVIVKYRDEKTDRSIELEPWLR